MSIKGLGQKIEEILRKVDSSVAGKWEECDITQNGKEGRKKAYEVIDGKLKEESGVYVYLLGDDCLYVGKSLNLNGRIKQHYRESHLKVKKGNRGKRWYDFFGRPEHQGEMRIFYKKMGDKKVKVIEQMLIYFLERKIVSPERCRTKGSSQAERGM